MLSDFHLETCFAPWSRALFERRSELFSILTWKLICFAPQPCALVQQLNFQTCSEHWAWCAFRSLTSECSSRHSGVQFLISHPTKCLRTRRFSEPTLQPSGATKHLINALFCDFARALSFSLCGLYLLWFFSFPRLFSQQLLHLSISRKFDF